MGMRLASSRISPHTPHGAGKKTEARAPASRRRRAPAACPESRRACPEPRRTLNRPIPCGAEFSTGHPGRKKTVWQLENLGGSRLQPRLKASRINPALAAEGRITALQHRLERVAPAAPSAGPGRHSPQSNPCSCFSWQAVQCRAQGTASRRFCCNSVSQTSQTP